MKSEVYDLTTPQKSILFTEQFYNGSTVNNICGTAIIDSVLDFDVLKKAVNVFVENNDSFQLKLVLDNNEMKQFKDSFVPFDVEVVDLDDKEDLASLEKDVLSHHFDVFGDEWLYIIKLFRFKDGSGGFTVNVHHLISDSWTLGILAREIVRIYSCLIEDAPADEIEKSIAKNDDFSYINYIASEKEYVSSSKFEKDKEYWNGVFATVPEPVTIPSVPRARFDCNKSCATATTACASASDVVTSNIVDNFSCAGNRCSFTFSSDIMDRINAYCKDNGFSVFNFLMAVYSLYIARVSNSDDFVIGTPILNRTNFKEKNTTGMFINIAPLRVNVDNSLDFKSFALSIAKDSMAMLRHQKYSYQYILEDLRNRDISLPNLYNIVLSYQITNAVDGTLPYKTTWSFNGNCADDIDIQFYDINNCGSIIVAYDYKVSKYSSEDIESIHNRAVFIIEQVLDNSDICLSDIDIVTSSEKNELLEVFNDTAVEYDFNKTIHGLFEEQVSKTPNKIAIVCNNEKLSYNELNNKANMVANYLINSGVKPRRYCWYYVA